MTNADSSHLHKVLKDKQALIPQKFKKSLQAKALMNHYQSNEIQKLSNEKNKLQERMQQMQWSKEQNQRHLYEIQMKKQIKEFRKNQYSRNYDQMIHFKKTREQEQKNQQLWLEKRLLNEDTWLRDTYQQKQIEKQKKLQYGRELQKHLKLQEEKRNEEAVRIKQLRQRFKKQTSQLSRPYEIPVNYKGKNMTEQRNSQNLGVKGLLNWSQSLQARPLDDPNQRPLTPRMDHMLKMQHQRYYQKGQSAQFKNEQHKRYFQRNNPEKSSASKFQKAENYNPITNPIPFKYKNPNVLKVLSSFS